MCSRETPETTEDRLIIIITTTNSIQEAKRLAEIVVSQRMAACVSISSPVLSVYRWRDQVEREDEFMLFIKTVEENYPQIEACLVENHNYDVPEILSISVDRFEETYGNWLRQNSRPFPGGAEPGPPERK